MMELFSYQFYGFNKDNMIANKVISYKTVFLTYLAIHYSFSRKNIIK